MKQLLLLAVATASLSALPAQARDRDDGPPMRWMMMQDSRGRLGVQVQTMTDELRKYFGAPDDQGVLVSGVIAGSAAEKAGLAAGDVIVEVDGHQIEDSRDLVRKVGDEKAGQDFPIVVIRDHKSVKLTARLTEDADASPFQTLRLPDGNLQLVTPDVRELRKELDETRDQLKDLQKRVDQLEKKK